MSTSSRSSSWDKDPVGTACTRLDIRDRGSWTEFWNRLDHYEDRLEDGSHTVDKKYEQFQLAFQFMMRYHGCPNLAYEDWTKINSIIKKARTDLGIKNPESREEFWKQLESNRLRMAAVPKERRNWDEDQKLQDAFDVMIEYHRLPQYVGKYWMNIRLQDPNKKATSSTSTSRTTTSSAPQPKPKPAPTKRPEPPKRREPEIVEWEKVTRPPPAPKMARPPTAPKVARPPSTPQGHPNPIYEFRVPKGYEVPPSAPKPSAPGNVPAPPAAPAKTSGDEYESRVFPLSSWLIDFDGDDRKTRITNAERIFGLTRTATREQIAKKFREISLTYKKTYKGGDQMAEKLGELSVARVTMLEYKESEAMPMGNLETV
ncbi:hypothetical protein K491DRAFT_782150 [Lophiostoma macrostomum CBS 122681]|uniref:Uncharacterized protein n=1 Tax=Lophiostoma macrostomum CBS 122681 TaxID=1314788 RepID=A0A6A6SXW0_9PLEO|nr:hypothetical protein K491DRAFT_782150 [Lophiostoma macrostomum CBS 122681]